MSKAIIVDGKTIADQITQGLKPRVESLKKKGITPALAAVIVGNDQASHTYVRKKSETAQLLGITFFKFAYPASVTKQELIAEIEKIQSENKLHGLIIQLPVPEELWADTRELANHIKIDIDVDCLSHLALGRVMMNESPLIPPTPGAILDILKHHEVDLKGMEICLVGRGALIGKPLAVILANYPVTLTVCGRATKDLASLTKRADIIITGVGKKDLVTGSMVKKGAVVVDAGVCFVGGKMYGDIEFKTVSAKASLVTPTPGGVGPITVANLLANTVKVAEGSL
ncbi:MAG: bifunctional 5,10-methylenetetrahydrofolate dehydrogenase/5,10-methenyltetrahydrofolate cyclohydrolase [Candidatus Doudnabacteria bacterium]|nr:bifunctional 5,10-methylenetetrahydrofolate dehydrogenase/5,10-methenyltetrahydrofolate cyclohydrolase [Candidatus Doudnabacteria bacterium]